MNQYSINDTPNFVPCEESSVDINLNGANQGDKAIKTFPELKSEAFYGLAGEFAQFATEYSEADPAAVLVTFLTFAGAAFGTNRYFPVGPSKHHPRLFTTVVGATSKARKGTSLMPVKALMEVLYEDHSYLERLPTTPGPLSSGEGLIFAVRDHGTEKKKGKLVDPGVKDKRLLVTGAEFGAALKAMQRESNTLSTTLRELWDSGDIKPMTKFNQIKTTSAHVCILGHITYDELKRYLDKSDDIYNGFANRFLWVCARRQKEIPIPKILDAQKLKIYGNKLASALEKSTQIEMPIYFSTKGKGYWNSVYHDLTKDEPGAFGAITARSEPLVLRVALIYALLDQSDCIDAHHIEAALGLWNYSKASAMYLFGVIRENSMADEILKLLSSGKKTQTEINKHFHGNSGASQIQEALTYLQNVGRISQHKNNNGIGRPTTYWEVKEGFVGTN